MLIFLASAWFFLFCSYNILNCCLIFLFDSYRIAASITIAWSLLGAMVLGKNSNRRNKEVEWKITATAGGQCGHPGHRQTRSASFKKKPYGRHWISQFLRIEELEKKKKKNVSHVMHQVSHVTCHLSHDTNANSHSHGPSPC